MPTFIIRNLKVGIGKKSILKGLSLTLRSGQIHALMGPNGSGKSTLANAILSHPDYKKTAGNIKLGGVNLTKLSPDKIARAGVMMAFQHPQSIPGVSVENLLRFINYETKKTAAGSVNLAAELSRRSTALGLSAEYLRRPLNEGFSGGEKKKMEILQLSVLRPRVLILDEIDSGLDVDALKLVAASVNFLVKNGSSVLIITHYNRILKYLKPDFVHIMKAGKIVKSGNAALAGKIEKHGYALST